MRRTVGMPGPHQYCKGHVITVHHVAGSNVYDTDGVPHYARNLEPVGPAIAKRGPDNGSADRMTVYESYD